MDGCRAIGVTLGVPAVSQLGIVDGHLVDRAFHDERRTHALELGRVDDLAHLVAGAVPPYLATNALAAAALARAVGVAPEAVHDGLAGFALDHHRTAFVRELDGVTYVDDSKATNAHAVNAAFGGFGPGLRGVDRRRPREGPGVWRARRGDPDRGCTRSCSSGWISEPLATRSRGTRRRYPRGGDCAGRHCDGARRCGRSRAGTGRGHGPAVTGECIDGSVPRLRGQRHRVRRRGEAIGGLMTATADTKPRTMASAWKSPAATYYLLAASAGHPAHRRPRLGAVVLVDRVAQGNGRQPVRAVHHPARRLRRRPRGARPRLATARGRVEAAGAVGAVCVDRPARCVVLTAGVSSGGNRNWIACSAS